MTWALPAEESENDGDGNEFWCMAITQDKIPAPSGFWARPPGETCSVVSASGVATSCGCATWEWGASLAQHSGMVS